MKELIDHLHRIAKANNDSFIMYIDVQSIRIGIKYTLNVEEVSDNHCFLCKEVYDDVNNFTKEVTNDVLKSACQYWNYNYVE